MDTFENDAFIGFHGSWNRDTPTGYKVVRVKFKEEVDSGNRKRMVPDKQDGEGKYKDQVNDFLWSGDGRGNKKAQWKNGFRPVDVKFDRFGRLLVSNDGTRRGRSGSGFTEGMVVMIVHNSN